MKDILDIADLPVVFMSMYGKDQAVVRAFETGASDYIVKPFSPTELIARIRAALRRRMPPARSEPSEPYVRGDLVIDYAERRVTVRGEPLELTPTEYDLLVELSIDAGRVVTHDHLLLRVWGPDKPGGVHTSRTHLMRLRRKLGESAEGPHLHLRRAPCRLPHGEGGDAGAGDVRGGDRHGARLLMWDGLTRQRMTTLAFPAVWIGASQEMASVIPRLSMGIVLRGRGRNG